MSNTPNNGPNHVRESANDNQAILNKKDIVSKFAKEKYDKESLSFYNEITRNGIESDASFQNKISGEFNDFKSRFSAFKGFEIGAGKDMEFSDFFKALKGETLRLGMGIETRRKHLLKTFEREYDLDANQLAILKDEINKKTTLVLDELSKKQSQRKSLIDSLFPQDGQNNVKPNDRDFNEFLNSLNIDVNSLDGNQLDSLLAISRLSKSRKIYPADLEALLFEEPRIFQTLEQKQLLIKYFLPSISIQDLIDWKVIDIRDQKEITSLINEQYRVILEENGLNPDDFEDELNSNSYLIHPSELVISTYTFPEDIVDKILKKDNLSNLASELNKLSQELEREDRETIKGYNSFLKKLSGDNIKDRVSGVDHLKEGNVMQFTTKDENGKKHNIYSKIVSLDKPSESEFELVEFATDKEITTPDPTKKRALSYVEVVRMLQKDQKLSVGFIDEKVFDEMIENDENIVRDSLDLTPEKREKIQSEIEKIDAEIELKKEELERKGLSESQIEADEEYSALLDKKLEAQSEYDNYYLNNLKHNIDKVDPNGQAFGFGKGTCFAVKDTVYEIGGIDEEARVIELVTFSGKQFIDYESFYHTFKEVEAKRVKKINNFEEFKALNWGEAWKNVKLENGKLYEEEDKEKGGKKKEVEYILGKHNEFFKVVGVYGDKITFHFGEYKDPDKEKGKPGALLANPHAQTISLNEFAAYIKGKDFKPFYPNPDTNKEKDTANNTFKGSLLNRIFSGMSLSEIIAGGKMTVDNISEYLKRGNELKSAKLALALGKFLPSELSNEFLIKVESSEAEQMDKAKEALGKIDSFLATKLIEKRLLNKDTPEHKKEAGMIFMLEKYGTLYAKALYDGKNYKTNFLWYEAMGGTVGDDLYNKTKAEMEKYDVQFTEEELLWNLMKKQCTAGGYNGKKRRSRLHKQYKSTMPKGIGDEIETGLKDGNDPRTVEGRIRGGMGEMKGGTYANAFGWIQRVVDKGGSIQQMNIIPFVMAFSGIGYKMDQKLAGKMPGLVAKGKILPIAWFLSKQKGGLDLFGDTVIELAREIKEAYPDKADILGDAQKIRKNQLSTTISESDKIKATEEFWGKYGDVLSNALHMLNVGSSDKYSKVTKVIFFKKDENPVFKRYYDTLHAILDQAEFAKGDAAGHMTDAFDKKGISGAHFEKVATQNLQLGDGGFKTGEVGQMFWSEIVDEIESIPKKQYSSDPVENRKLQKKLLMENFRTIISVVKNLNGGIMNLVDTSDSIVGSYLHEWGIYIRKDFGVSATSIKAGSKDDLLSTIADNFIDGKVSTAGARFSLNDLIERTRIGVDNVGVNTSSNDNGNEAERQAA